jgi:hypothetical protein
MEQQAEISRGQGKNPARFRAPDRKKPSNSNK